MGKKTRRVLGVFLVLVLGVSMGMVIRNLVNSLPGAGNLHSLSQPCGGNGGRGVLRSYGFFSEFGGSGPAGENLLYPFFQYRSGILCGLRKDISC